MSNDSKRSRKVGTMNKPGIQTKGSGFTIIEVVLVLAIAGLIFLMVFLALPALQRSQRDTQRKTDVSRFMSQLSSYQSNNRGNVPPSGSINSFVTSYLNVGTDSFTDPQTGDPYTVRNTSGSVPTAGSVYYVNGTTATCTAGAPSASGSAANGRKVAVAIGLEGGGAYCQTN